MKTVTVVIPAYNEETRIGSTVRAVRESGFADQILVMDDGSQDKTAVIARGEGAEVIELKPNRGKGEALNRAVPHIKGDIVLFLDADLGDSARQGQLLVKPILEGEADITIARFPPPKKKGGFGLVKGLAAWGLKRAGMEAREPLSGQRAMSKTVLMDLLPFSPGFGVELGMSLRALARGYRLLEVDTTMTHAETGRDVKGFVHRGRQFWDVLKVILKEAKGGPC
ncbi:MAG: glycosyltransferase family 2 protein [Syntrophothermus sp.]|uniref:glycosyltransferase family 2 protein n=1 Tax=Syntrophothermus sp. TaxID=2736299 RepID=UPI00257A59EB|nr:glycosyltransferase family 2 protein [Syntrophothermus sp.]NSW84354.1 glycosyltransferase family 2 protein [Syntrophothermus sp.]